MNSIVYTNPRWLALLGALGVLLSAGMAQADRVITVNTTLDDNAPSTCQGGVVSCSLRQAIAVANDPVASTGVVVIHFDPVLFAVPVPPAAFPKITLLFQELPVVTNANRSQLVIDATGASVTIDANQLSRIFTIDSGSNVALTNLHLERGKTTGAPAQGGAILNNGKLLITLGSINNNRAENNVAQGGAIFNSASGDLSLQSVTLSGNVAHGTTSGFSSGTASGGAIYSDGILAVGFTTINANTSAGDGIVGGSPLSVGGGISASGNAVVVNSTVSGNTASVNTTFTGNEDGGGIYLAAGTSCDIQSSTITLNNSTGFAGVGGLGTPKVENSIVAGNLNFDINESNFTGEFDLVSPAATDLKLEALANNGGPTLTHRLLLGSRALGTGNPLVIQKLDQRGLPRFPQAAYDVGAYQNQAPVARCLDSGTTYVVNADASCKATIVATNVDRLFPNQSFDPDLRDVLSYAIAGTTQFTGHTASSSGTTASAFTLTVTDPVGASSSCQTNLFVTVQDTSAPTLPVIPPIAAKDATSNLGAVVTYAAPVASDNCGVASFACLPASGSRFAVGDTTVTCTATDFSGNSAVRTATVHVNAEANPVLDCSASNITVKQSADLTQVSPLPPVIKNNASDTKVVCFPTGAFAVGDTTVQCTATNSTAGEVGGCSFVVTVTAADISSSGCDASGSGMALGGNAVALLSCFAILFAWRNRQRKVAVPNTRE